MYTILNKIPVCKYYTYILINPLTNLPFYIGKGQDDRYSDHIRDTLADRESNLRKRDTIKEILNTDNKIIVDIIYESHEEIDCLNEEKNLIKKYGKLCDGTGILTNLTDGGENANHGIETRKKQSELKLGAKNPFYHKKHTEEHKQRLRENNPGGKATSKPIYQIDLEGNVIKKWPSARQAGVGLEIKNWRNICLVAKKNKKQTINKFYWRYIGDTDVVDGKLIDIENLNKNRLDPSLRSGKPIQQLSLDGKLIATWKNMCEAARQLKISNTAISMAIKKDKSYAGFKWKLC